MKKSCFYILNIIFDIFEIGNLLFHKFQVPCAMSIQIIQQFPWNTIILSIKIWLIFYPSPEFFTTSITMGHQISNIWQNGDSSCPWPDYCYFLANNVFVMFFGPFLRVNNFTLKVLLTRKTGFIGCFVRIVTSTTKQDVATVSVNFRKDFEIRTSVFPN